MELERRFAQHYAEKPLVGFEVEEHGEYGPRIIITNLHQYPLTAFVVRMEPKPVDDVINALVYDTLTRVGLLAPIPRGISSIPGAPHQVGGPVSDAHLAAAVWEDGSTYGPDNLLLRISSSRRESADSYARAMAELQTGRIGLLRNTWQPSSRLNPRGTQGRQPRRRRSQQRSCPAIGSPTICSGPPRRIDPPPVWLFWRGLYSRASQPRDSLRQALGGSIAPAHQTK